MKPIFDNGHGGVIGGKYQTQGKRSPNWNKGILYEGMFNRWLVNRLIEKCDRCGIPYYHVSPELTDISLSKRVSRANKIYEKDSSTYLLSMHSNAGGGTGFEGFTSKGETKSDQVAQKFLEGLKAQFTGFRHRHDLTDGDMDKEALFTVITRTHCPAVLLEILFMDNKEDYAHLWSPNFLSLCADSLFETIKDLYYNN